MRRFSLASVLLVAVLAVLGTSTTSRAIFLHNFNCAYCHLPGTTYATLTADNVCLQCHKPSPPNVTFADGIARTSDAGFVPNDASNAMGSRPATVVGGAQTSHLWASSKNTVTAAGATAPSTTFYKSNYNTSTGKLTCSICHNPHADADPTKRNVNSLRPVAVQPVGTNVANQACLACHGSWNSATTHGLGTHPINVSYPGVNANDGYVDSAPSDANLTLVDGKVTCVTCHGTHFTDSNASTTDGAGAVLTASTRGVMLKGNGPEREAATGTGICTSCHEYGAHGSPVTKLGCMVCHGGHNASDANPNIFMLNRTITLPDNPSTPVVGDPVTVTLNYSDPAYATATPVGYAGICAACHTNSSLPVGHNPTSDCATCHNHGSATGSFAASCSSCHGYPPVDDTAKGPTGYAVDPNAGAGFLKGYKYLDDGTTLRTVYKNETNTPHKAHAAGGGDYTFGCAQCHSAQSWLNLTTHVNNNFQDVAFVGQLAVTGGLGAAYNPAVTGGNDGVCSNIYCHSNGGKRTGDGTRSYTAATVPAWENGSVAGAITTCNACHDGSAEMDGVADRNSAAHVKHIAKGYTCNLCHKDTASNNTTLAVGAIGGKHVNGNHDVVFNSAYSLGAANLNSTASSYPDATAGTCSVYCHSNGTTQIAADWDDPATGACGACHQVSVGGVPTGTGPALGGAHAKHLYTADNGVQLACTVCHTNNGTGADHVNGAKSMNAGVCNGCHGATNGGTGNDREPNWYLASSVDCSTCHVGTLALINTRTAPAKNNFAVEGHGDPALTAAPACTGCHTLTAAHIDGAANSNMLTGGATANDAFCKACHTSPAVQSHYATTGASATGNACAICHEAHGDGMGTNTDAMLIVGAGFANRTQRSSYWNVAKNGVCQVCHDAAIVSHYNRTVDPAIAEAGHNPGKVCTECHKHDVTPAFKASCTDCHGNTATGNYWPDSGAEHGTAWPNRLGSHDIHITKIAKVKYATASPTVTQKNATCDYCHTGGGHSGDQAAAPADLGGFKNILGVANVRTVSTSQVGTDVTCSNVDCHYTTSPVATDWYTSGDQALANCNYCHVYTGTYTQGTLPNAHDKHMGETADGGRNMDCTQCHLSAGIDVAHQNGVIDFSTAAAPLEATLSIDVATTAGSKLGPKYGAAGAVATEFSSCANLECHGNFTGGKAANAPNWFNTDAQKGVGLGDGACGSCHGSDSAATPTSNKHAVHLGSNTYVPSNCADCHTKAAATHVYGSIDLGGNATVASAPGCTNACHTLDGLDNNAAATADNPSWTSANKLGCEDCHASGKTWAGAGGALLTRGLPPTSGKHAAHVGGYFAAGCVDCHASNAVTHSVLDNNVAVSGNKVSVYNVGTCTNTCHTLNGVDNAVGGGNDATWTSANLLGCVDCHSNVQTGLKANLAPTSGLHATGTAMAHDVQFKATAAEAAPGTATCTSCHSGTVTSQHIDTVGPTAFGAGGIAYTWNANINSYAAAGCAAKCHLDAAANGGNGKWSRKWNGVTDARPQATDDPGAAVCDNCHGDGVAAGTTTVDNIWNTGLVPAHLDSPDVDTPVDVIEMLVQHGNCKSCHGYGAASGYDKTWGTVHGDGKIRMNGPAGTGAGYDETQHGCLAACHTGSLTVVSDPNYNHTLADSGWTIDTGDYGSGDCATCHASAGRDHSGLTTESQASHDLHTGSELGIGACTQCHPHDGVSVPPGTGIHAVGGTVNFANKIPNTYDYSVADFGGNCATNTCHDTDGTTEWKAVSLGADACADCHNSGKTGAFTGLSAYPPSSNKHALHNNNTAVISNCSECHGHNGTLSSTAPYSNHIDGSLVIGGQLSGYTNPTCSNSCHDLAGNGGGAVTWTGATQLGCADCHNKTANTIAAPVYAGLSASVGPTGDKHLAHTTADADYVAGCAACHNHNGALGSFATTGHVNGVQKTLVATITVNADKSCTNSCHLAASANEWISGSLVCIDCHTTAKTLGAGGDAGMSGTVAPNTNKHALHMLKTAYVTGCTTCHSHNGALGAAGHVNGPTKADIEVAGQITVSPIAADNTCTNNCHVTAPTRNWVSGTLLCADCHATLKMGDMGTGNHAIHTSGVFPAAYDTAGRAASTTDYRFYCSNCHGTTLANHMNAINNVSGVGYAGSGGTCNATSCHSDGVGSNKTTPAWVGGTFTGDRCDECHGNSPTTNAHSVHAVGIHATDIYSGTTGLLTTATATKAHGDAATSTTINCNICHSATVTMARNKLGTLCVSCHTGDANDATNLMAVADKSKHVDGTPDVVFASSLIAGGFKSKAQLRDDITTVPSLTASWTRSGAYKTAAGTDVAKAAAPQFLGGKCSAIDCHNGIEATWQAPANDCMACHTELPK